MATYHETSNADVSDSDVGLDMTNVTAVAGSAAASAVLTTPSIFPANTTSTELMRNVTITVSENNGDIVGVDFGQSIIHDPNNYGYQVVQEDRNWVVVGVLIGLIVVLWVILAFMLCVPLIRFIRRKIPVSQKRIDRRYETIEGWLISKIVQPHDMLCTKIEEAFSSKSATEGNCNGSAVTATCRSATKHSQSQETDADCRSDAAMECPICMESFQLKQVVSWSAYEQCGHVFHHECIKEWLLRHKNCPFCREVFLPVDQDHVKGTSIKMFKELSDIRTRRCETTYFCIENGLKEISLHGINAKSTLAKEDLDQIKQKLKSGVNRSQLKKLRGSRVDNALCCDEGDAENQPIISPSNECHENETLPSSPDIESSNCSISPPPTGTSFSFEENVSTSPTTSPIAASRTNKDHDHENEMATFSEDIEAVISNFSEKHDLIICQEHQPVDLSCLPDDLHGAGTQSHVVGLVSSFATTNDKNNKSMQMSFLDNSNVQDDCSFLEAAVFNSERAEENTLDNNNEESAIEVEIGKEDDVSMMKPS